MLRFGITFATQRTEYVEDPLVNSHHLIICYSAVRQASDTTPTRITSISGFTRHASPVSYTHLA